jgi:hypothetical protein
MSKPSQKKFEKMRRREKESKKENQLHRQTRKSHKKELEYTGPKVQQLQKATRLPTTPEEIEAQIADNLEKLKKLEEAYQKEVLERDALNAALEAEGYESLQDKMKFLNEQAEAQAKTEYERTIKIAEKKVKKAKNEA